jgi:SAM-dependent methyltransferase
MREADGRAAEQAYEAMAPVYDAFTTYHDYEQWIDSLLPALCRHGLSGNRLLDVGCGTGKSFLPMLARGWRATGCDVSPAMLERARAKAGGAAELHVADMRELPVFGAFDLVWALGDVANYMHDRAELTSALSGMRANLAPGGLLVVDANPLGCYRGFFAETYEVERDGRRLTWRGESTAGVAAGSICQARFEVEAPAGEGGGVETSVHRQRHFPKGEVLECLAEAGLECLDVYGHGPDPVLEPLDELAHDKGLYIARPRQDSNLRPTA